MKYLNKGKSSLSNKRRLLFFLTSMVIAVVSWHVQTGPVVKVRVLVLVIVRVVIVLPHIVLGVDVVFVYVVVHFYVGEHVLQLGVVVVRDGSEGVENVRIDLRQLWQPLPILLFLSFLPPGEVWFHSGKVDYSQERVEEEVS